MGFFSNFLRDLPLYLLSLPVILVALSVHESAHGWAAYRLGDPTARNLGRITLNPIKHFDLFGFLCMLIVHIGWAKPVPINARYFKNPRRDMAITGAAGPLSNLCLAVINLLILRLGMLICNRVFLDEARAFTAAYFNNEAFRGSLAFTVVSLLMFLLYLGVQLNLMLAIFNLIPIPPFDGSRIFYAFLPPKIYFGIMKYEQIIMLVFILLFALGFLSGPLQLVENAMLNGLFWISGMGEGTDAYWMFDKVCGYVISLLQLR